MKRLLIVWHSRTGASRALADAAAQGAGDEAETVMRRAAEATAEDLLGADGYLFVGPENLAALSGEMKEFFDRSYYAVLDRLNGRPYAHIVAAGSDGENAARQMARIATGWRLKPVAEPLIVCTHAQTPEAIAARKHPTEGELAAARDLGQSLAAGLALGIF